jgi:dimethylglycine dehydrogenase
MLCYAGPAARLLARELCPPLAELPFLRAANLDVLGVPVRAFAISFTGELGFELHADARDAARLLDAILDHPASDALGLRPFGSHAVNALRVEKGFKVKADLDFAHWHEAGIGPFVKHDRRKGAANPFVGRDAPLPAPARRAAIFEVGAPDAFAWSVPGDCPVRDAAGQLVGFTTSSARGAVSGKTIAMGYLQLDEHGAARAAPGDAGLTIECFGNRWPLSVLARPPVAPGHAGELTAAQPTAAAT